MLARRKAHAPPQQAGYTIATGPQAQRHDNSLGKSGGVHIRQVLAADWLRAVVRGRTRRRPAFNSITPTIHHETFVDEKLKPAGVIER
jgi:hypothetical protein